MPKAKNRHSEVSTQNMRNQIMAPLRGVFRLCCPFGLGLQCLSIRPEAESSSDSLVFQLLSLKARLLLLLLLGLVLLWAERSFLWGFESLPCFPHSLTEPPLRETKWLPHYSLDDSPVCSFCFPPSSPRFPLLKACSHYVLRRSSLLIWFCWESYPTTSERQDRLNYEENNISSPDLKSLFFNWTWFEP